MVYATAEELRGSEDGIRQIRSRDTELARKLMDELLPICRYVQAFYRSGRYISVKWIHGSQSYDAELHQQGGLIEAGHYSSTAYLEVTCAMHENEHRARSILANDGVVYAPEGISVKKGKPWKSEPVVFSNEEHVSNFAPIILDRIKKKASISYPEETSLVVQCSLNSLYMPNEWRCLVESIESQLSPLPFKEVLLIDDTGNCSTPLIFRRGRQ